MSNYSHYLPSFWIYSFKKKNSFPLNPLKGTKEKTQHAARKAPLGVWGEDFILRRSVPTHVGMN